MSNNLMNGKIGFTQNEDIKQILISCFKKDVRERADTRSLLQNIIQTIDKISFSREEQKTQMNSQIVPQFDNRFGKIPVNNNFNDGFNQNNMQRDIDNFKLDK